MLTEAKIQYFLSLTQTLSFSQTGTDFGVSQQAISKSIASLEEDLKTTLFLRSRNFVLLTDAGSEWRDFFQNVTALYDTARQDIQSRYATEAMRLRLGCQNYMELWDITGGLLDRVAKQNPGADIQIEHDSPLTLWHSLLSGHLDAILICKRFTPEAKGVCEFELFQIPLVLMISILHPKCKEAKSYLDFATEPLVVDLLERETRDTCMARAHRECTHYGLKPNRIIMVPNRDSVYSTVQMGKGFLLGTSVSRMHPWLKSYSLNASDPLLCVYRYGETNPLVFMYVNLLKEYCTSPDFSAPQFN